MIDIGLVLGVALFFLIAFKVRGSVKPARPADERRRRQAMVDEWMAQLPRQIKRRK